MTNHVVSLPQDATDSAGKREAIALAAIITLFAVPGRFAARDLEYSLSVRFASIAQLSLSDINAWLAELGVPVIDLGAEIAQVQQGNPDALRILLHAQNDQGMVQLLHLADASQLVNDAGLHITQTATPCFALRTGYTDTDPYGFYRVSLPGYTLADVRLAWGSIIAAHPDGGMAIAAPKPPIDTDAAKNALEIAEQAILTATNAHNTLKSALGL